MGYPVALCSDVPPGGGGGWNRAGPSLRVQDTSLPVPLFCLDWFSRAGAFPTAPNVCVGVMDPLLSSQSAIFNNRSLIAPGHLHPLLIRAVDRCAFSLRSFLRFSNAKVSSDHLRHIPKGSDAPSLCGVQRDLAYAVTPSFSL